MKFEVRIGVEAERDLESIYDFIVDNDGIDRAGRALDALMRAAESLATSPQRGSRPRELEGTGYSQYRQLVQGPWRIVYRVDGKRVLVTLVADGRRDLRTVLAVRLLDARV